MYLVLILVRIMAGMVLLVFIVSLNECWQSPLKHAMPTAAKTCILHHSGPPSHLKQISITRVVKTTAIKANPVSKYHNHKQMKDAWM
jgi:hypothetical protein